MIKIINFLIFFLSAYANSVFAEQSCEETALQSSVVKIYSSRNNSASGILIAQDLVLTVLHALPIGQKLYIDFPNYTAEAELINSHHGFDLALLRTQSDQYKKLNISSNQPAVDDVFAVSYPARSPLTVTSGKAIKSTYKGLLTSTHIDAGSSGGAIFQCQQSDWQLIGVIRSYAAHRVGNKLVNSGLAWSTPSEHVLSFLNFANTNNQASIAFVNHH